MPKTNTNTSPSKLAHGVHEPFQFTHSTFERVNWPALPTSRTKHKSSSGTSSQVSDKVLALQTTRLPPQQPLSLKKNGQVSTATPFDAFNLAFHVGDNAEQVTSHRNVLKQFINQQLINKQVTPSKQLIEEVKIQWLEQVHGNRVVEITTVDGQVITADASITRQKNVALAIMTADCLPILLSNKDGCEIAAIHGGWRPLAANIIEKTLEKMHSKPAELVAWLGPCIGKDIFEVGREVKEAFTQQDVIFNHAFIKQVSGKYLADLQKIARLQLQSLGVTAISCLAECTYQATEQYYSYRKEQITGRMASVICRR
ncbi:peptidoglycan editing factor PgeF [Colwellia sp. TT2012]|uniref:peptidoglycan editing factor PgeF n=1 Tax=Colwellia sp. TT2012 TaxID=1720342 RepID=UPI00070FEB10|nr:peptidoglycan editing factor PgeF [Colwellia sp. TT2012]